MMRHNLPLTRDSYIGLAGGDDWTDEDEASMPPPFRQQS